MPHTIAHLRQRLEENSTAVGPPAVTSELSAFEKNHTLRLHDGLKTLYAACNGAVCVGRSLISLRKVSEIERTCSSTTMDENYFLIGDIMLDADYITASLTNKDTPVMLFLSGERLAADFDRFLADLIDG